MLFQVVVWLFFGGNIVNESIMGLTLENLIEYCKSYSKEEGLNEESNLTEFIGTGDDVIDFLDSLSIKFNIDFSNFDFGKYFYYQNEEINTFTWFGLKKIKDKSGISVNDLFKYMQNNIVKKRHFKY